MVAAESSPSPLNGERAGVRGAIDAGPSARVRPFIGTRTTVPFCRQIRLPTNGRIREDGLLSPALSSRGGEGEDSEIQAPDGRASSQRTATPFRDCWDRRA